MTVKIMSLKC